MAIRNSEYPVSSEAAAPIRLVPALVRSVALLQQLCDAGPQSLGQLVSTLGLPRTTVFELLRTMEELGLARRHPGARYGPGLRLFELGAGFLRQLDVRQLARPYMEALTSRHRETSHLGMLDPSGDEVVCVEKVDSPEAIGYKSWLGKRNPCYPTAVGKVLLAWMPADRLTWYLETASLCAYTPKTVWQPEELRRQLLSVRQRGFALDDEEYHSDVRSAAAPILGPDGSCVAAVSLIGPSSRINVSQLNEMGEAVLAATRELSCQGGEYAAR